MNLRCTIQRYMRISDIRSFFHRHEMICRGTAMMMSHIRMLLILFRGHALISSGSVTPVVEIQFRRHETAQRRRIVRMTGWIQRQIILKRTSNDKKHYELKSSTKSRCRFIDISESTYSYHNVGQRTIYAAVTARLGIRWGIWSSSAETEHVRMV